MIILINGALGSGKTSLGEALASSCCIPSSRGRENDQQHQEQTSTKEKENESRSLSRNLMEGCAVVDVDHLVNFHQHKENQGNRGSCYTIIFFLLFIQWDEVRTWSCSVCSIGGEKPFHTLPPLLGIILIFLLRSGS